MTDSEKTYCAVCAWRETCRKRFKIKDKICPDYTRDLSLPRPEEEEEEKHERTDSQGH